MIVSLGLSPGLQQDASTYSPGGRSYRASEISSQCRWRRPGLPAMRFAEEQWAARNAASFVNSQICEGSSSFCFVRPSLVRMPWRAQDHVTYLPDSYEAKRAQAQRAWMSGRCCLKASRSSAVEEGSVSSRGQFPLEASYPGPTNPARLEEAPEGLLELLRHARRDRQAVRLEEALLQTFDLGFSVSCLCMLFLHVSARWCYAMSCSSHVQYLK